jgi:SAM-dependent methyltransferase
MSAAVWHDVECGSYVEDRELWRELADAAGGPVLDVGAGTGRVALDLAARGIEVVALDHDPELLEVLQGRAAAAALSIEIVAGDARSFALGDRRFGLVIVPMQTLQLLGGAEDRAGFLRSALAHLRPAGTIAVALADALESFDAASDGLPEPDVAIVDGVRYASLPLAVVDEGPQIAIHRLRQAGDAESHDVIRLDRVSPAQLAEEAEVLGLIAAAARQIPATEVYVGSTVVILHG